MKRRTFALFFLACHFTVPSVLGQTTDSLVERFDAFRNRVLQEKIYVHIDRSGYFVGETMWFKIYHVDATFHKPLPLQSVAYVELIDKNHHAVWQAKILLKSDGTGSGSFSLPATLGAGQYTFRAYTNWMKNFPAEYFFQQNISVIDPFNVTTLSDHPSTLPKNEIRFFPEGGNLVYGLESRVAFSVPRTDRNPVSLKGAILTHENDTVTAFETFRSEIGSFTFRPEPNETYVAKILTGDGEILTSHLPAILEKGYVMHVYDSADFVNVMVLSNKSDANEMVYLLMHTRSHGIFADKGHLQESRYVFRIEKSMLKGGISHITIFDEAQHPVCERLYFNKCDKKLDILVSNLNPVFGRRKKVEINFKTRASNGAQTSANLSVAVYRMDSLGLGDTENIHTYLNYTSDLGGETANVNVGYYLASALGGEQAKKIDLLMLTHGWRRFLWNDVFNKMYTTFKHNPERIKHTISGTIMSKSTGEPVRNTTAYLSLQGAERSFHIVRSDSSGNFLFQSNHCDGDGQIFFWLGDDDHEVTIHVPYANAKNDIPVRTAQPNEHLADEINSRSIYLQVENIFYSNRVVEKKSIIERSPFFGVADKTYLLDDFVRFPTMEEVLREYIPEVMVRKKNDRFNIRVENSIVDSKTFLDGAPLILVDGVPIFDADHFIDIDPLKIKSLSVVSRKYYYGGLSFDGVIDCRSYDGDLTTFASANNFSILKYQFLMAPREFYSPSYTDNDSSRLPDARILLHWVPTVQTDENGNAQINFYTSDIRGKYLIVVQGLSPDGEAGYTSTHFTVDN